MFDVKPLNPSSVAYFQGLILFEFQVKYNMSVCQRLMAKLILSRLALRPAIETDFYCHKPLKVKYTL